MNVKYYIHNFLPFLKKCERYHIPHLMKELRQVLLTNKNIFLLYEYIKFSNSLLYFRHIIMSP